MQWLRMLLSRLVGSGTKHQSATATELDAELESHLEMLADEKAQRGLPPDEARRQAMLELGNNTRIREEYRHQAGLPFLEVLWQDIRYALRILYKSPGFAAVAIVTLALGIGANSAIFSLVNGVLLRPLPYSHPEQLVSVFSSNSSKGLPNFGTSPPDFRTLREKNRTLAGLSAEYGEALNLTGTDQPERVQGLVVSSDYFTTLGVMPALGRNFLPEEEKWGAHHEVILSNEFWRTHLNADPDISGKPLTLDGEVYTVIGVMPAGFYVQRPVQIWLPMAWKPKDNFDTHNNYFLSMVGRLRPGVTQAQALSDLNEIMLGIAEQFPENQGIGAALTPLRQVWLGDARLPLIILLAAVGFVLLLACANVANLLLARSATRQKEIAIRSALGANRARLLRQFITESLLLSALGGTLGLALAYFSMRLLPLASDMLGPRMQEVHLDSTVLLFTVGVSAATALVFGLMPALESSRLAGINNTLKEGSRTSASSGSGRTRVALVISEVALALVLLIGSGLAIRSFARLMKVDAGFAPEHVLTFGVNLPDTYDPDPDPLRIGASPRMIGFYQALLSRIEQLPGIKAAGYVSTLPLTGESWGKGFVPLDRPLPTSLEKMENIQYRAVLGDYFASLRIPVIEGRVLNDHDQTNTPYVVVINEALARRDWPGQNPIGKTVLLAPPESLIPPNLLPPGYHPQKFTVVGVVADVHYGSMDQPAVPMVYGSILQHDAYLFAFITVRSDGDPTLLVPSIRDVLKQIDPNIPMAQIRTMEEIVSSSVAQPRLEAILLGAFGALALILASIGVYGVMAYSVSQRTSEIGIRMALGASRSSVLRMVLSQGIRMTAIGLAIGCVAAIGLTRLMSGLLFGVSPTDPLTFAAVLVVLAAIAMLACYLPARRATKVDPMRALRYE